MIDIQSQTNEHSATVVAIHSFRRAAGRSTLAANLCALLASQGQRVVAVDADFHDPSLHMFFNLPEREIGFTLNDYLWGRCTIGQACYDLSQRLAIPPPGKLALIPASGAVGDILQVLRSPTDLDLLDNALQQIEETWRPSYIILDTHAGLDQDTLLAIASANVLVILLRPEPYELQGTAVTVEVARDLNIPRLLLATNFTPGNLDTEKAWQDLEESYGCEVVALLPYSDELVFLASSRLLALEFPDDPYITDLKKLAERLPPQPLRSV
jgi:MinD-like ATPase involved in chromosome partitioning or flagellar assembly